MRLNYHLVRKGLAIERIVILRETLWPTGDLLPPALPIQRIVDEFPRIPPGNCLSANYLFPTFYQRFKAAGFFIVKQRLNFVIAMLLFGGVSIVGAMIALLTGVMKTADLIFMIA